MTPLGPKMLNRANRALFWVPTIANIKAPTVAEITAGKNITLWVTAANYAFGITGNAQITDPGLGDKVETSVPDIATIAAEMDMFRFKNAIDDVAWSTFTAVGIFGYLVERVGQIEDDEDQEDTPVKALDEVQVAAVITNDPVPLTPSTAGYEKFKQTFSIQKHVARAIVAAA